MKKFRFTIRKDSRTSIRKDSVGFGAAGTAPGSVSGPFCYASVCKLSKYRCRSCDAPIRSLSVRRVALCPVCKAENELK